MDFFVDKNISPMLLEEQKEPFDDENYIFELKLDGIRAIAYLEKDAVYIRNKRNKELIDIYPELKSIFKQAKKPCVLDGELVVLNNDGSPNFFALQKRSLMTDPLRIELEASKNKVHFVAYDILQLGKDYLTDLPLLKRKEFLAKNIVENDLLAISRYIVGQGIKLFNLTKDRGLEGIVAKEKNSRYEIGKRSKNWIKVKNLVDEDFLICGFTLDEDGNIKDLILGQEKEKKLVYRGKVFLHISKEEQEIITAFALKNQNKKALFEDISGDIIWIKPELVCTVQYMMLTKDGAMRQPVFKGLRDDK